MDIGELQTILENEGTGWSAASTPLSQLSLEEKKLRLGVDPTRTRDERQAAITGGLTSGFPETYDLRNVNSQNFVTAIKDQSSCGSCVAFACCAAIEGTLRVQQKDPNLPVNLSEAHLFYCNGRNCTGGWWPDDALSACQDTGVTDEACYVYTPGNQPCNLCNDWRDGNLTIRDYLSLTGIGVRLRMKSMIATTGPITACFDVYDDFYAYVDGVYTHVTGEYVGGHCVAIVGYDLDGWICKNSWGTGWGQSGFFQIAYDECGIESTAVHAVVGVKGPWPPPAGNPRGYQGRGTDRVLYRGQDRNVHEIWLAGDHWEYHNHTASLGAPLAVGDPMGYQGGGTDRVVYRGTDNHVHEISLYTDGWGHFDHTPW